MTDSTGVLILAAGLGADEPKEYPNRAVAEAEHVAIEAEKSKLLARAEALESLEAELAEKAEALAQKERAIAAELAEKVDTLAQKERELATPPKKAGK